MAPCDAPIERQFAVPTPRVESDEPLGPLPRVKPGAKSKSQPGDEARAHRLGYALTPPSTSQAASGSQGGLSGATGSVIGR
jgi:hypothetical protein